MSVTREMLLLLPRYLEMETSRRCNRICEWCPNGSNAARRDQELMDWKLFCKVTQELGDLGFAGYWAFHNYNEPLLNPRLKQEIRFLRSAAPEARPAIYTNGDLMTADLFRELREELGVSYLRVTRYPKNADVQPTFAAIRRWLNTRGLLDAVPWTFKEVRQGLAAVHEADGMRAEVIRPRIAGYNSRGGTVTLLPVVHRTAPCLMTTTSAFVDFRGQMKMCCNIYPDDRQHQRYVVGSLRDHSFADLWFSPQMSDYRSRHAKADWSTSPACATCTQELPETRS